MACLLRKAANILSAVWPPVQKCHGVSGDPCLPRPHSWVHGRLFLVLKTSGIASTGWIRASRNWKWGCLLQDGRLAGPTSPLLAALPEGCSQLGQCGQEAGSGGSSQPLVEAPLGRRWRWTREAHCKPGLRPGGATCPRDPAGASRSRGNPRSSLEWGRAEWLGGPGTRAQARKPQLCFLTGDMTTSGFTQELQIPAPPKRKQTPRQGRAFRVETRSLESIHLGWCGGRALRWKM